MGKLKQLTVRFNETVDISSLAVYRIVFGFCMAINAFYYYSEDRIIHDFVMPKFFFSFELFNWLHLPILSPAGFNSLFIVMGLAACCVMVGLLTRASLAILLMTQLYIFLLEKAYAPDGPYLYILITFLLFLTSAGRAISVDVLINPSQKLSVVPFWQIAILRAQFILVYFFSGFSKLIYPDSLHAKQLSLWLPQIADMPLIGPLFVQSWLAYVFSWGGMIFDLTVGFLLLNKSTRVFAILAAVFFHGMNKMVLGLALMPWFALAGIIIFLEPETPRKIIRAVSGKIFTGKSAAPSGSSQPITKSLACFLAVYFVIQLLLPLRCFLYTGNASWTREGVRFSWHLMNDSFKTRMTVFYSPPSDVSCVDPQPFNMGQAWWMSGNPEIILQYAHYLKKVLVNCGVAKPEVYVDSQVSLNGREFYPLIDSSVNLANKTYPFLRTPDWILPHPDRQAQAGPVRSLHHEGLAEYKLQTIQSMILKVSR